MKKNTLARTNIIICLIILIGFVVTSVISYRSNVSIYENDAQQVSTLATDSIYNEITSVFAQPVNVSLTMANSTLLKDFLAAEKYNLTDEPYLAEMQKYLSAYRGKYSYDSVFLVSSATNRYYHYNGLDRVLSTDNLEDVWYYDFLKSDDEYSINVDNDQASGNTITVFVNCKIKSAEGKIMGVVGVGLKVDSLQAMLKSYEDNYNVSAYLVDHNGRMEISSTTTGYENLNLFDAAPYADNKSQMLNNEDSRQLFEYDEDMGIGYVVSQYEPNFKWFLIVENDMSVVSTQLQSQFCMGIVMIAIVIALVLFIITIVIRRYHKKIIELTVSQELEYQQLLHETTHGLYDSIYEVDITRNRAGGDGTRKYFESLGLSGDTPYDSALKLIADTQVKVEYIKGYLDTFLPENVLASYNNGITNLNYDLMLATDGVHYHWMRIIGRIFFWDTDKSVRMITYRENIDEEKQQEFLLLESSQRDSMTALYNKRTTEELIENVLKEDLNTGARRAFLMFDIDNFKSVNDSMGHNFGDHVIREIAAEIKSQFRESDIVGRIGGDEFVVLVMEFDSSGALQRKLERLCARISAKDVGIGQEYHISCSIGVAFSPKYGTAYSELYEHADQALYYAKAHGKNSYSVYGDNIDDNASYVGQRDIEVLINAATDGIAKYAYMPDIKLLYFNKRYMELTGMSSQILSAIDYHPLERIHPDDVSKLLAAINTAKEQKSMFTVTFRMQHHDGYYFHVTQRGIFIGELYKNKYPIYYVTYIKRVSQDDEPRE